MSAAVYSLATDGWPPSPKSSPPRRGLAPSCFRFSGGSSDQFRRWYFPRRGERFSLSLEEGRGAAGRDPIIGFGINHPASFAENSEEPGILVYPPLMHLVANVFSCWAAAVWTRKTGEPAAKEIFLK
jgi:hypothetical protein